MFHIFNNRYFHSDIVHFEREKLNEFSFAPDFNSPFNMHEIPWFSKKAHDSDYPLLGFAATADEFIDWGTPGAQCHNTKCVWQ